MLWRSATMRREAAAAGLGRRRAPPRALGLALLAPALAACGLASKGGRGAVTVTITRGFGAHRIADATQARVPAGETVLHLIRRRYALAALGTTVTALDGVRAAPGSRWFLSINGSATGLGTAKRPTLVHAGDRIWWDLHDAAATRSVPAVVGSFPEPFLSGVGGRRLPVTLECAPDVAVACDRVSSVLTKLGLPAARQLLGTGSGTDSLAVNVGTWADVRGEIAALLIEHGPSTGGVYARFVAGPRGGALQLLDPRGRPVRSLASPAGLVAATGNSSTVPTWFITGTDAGGVLAAASALTAARLDRHLALAVQGSSDFPVPQP